MSRYHFQKSNSDNISTHVHCLLSPASHSLSPWFVHIRSVPKIEPDTINTNGTKNFFKSPIPNHTFATLNIFLSRHPSKPAFAIEFRRLLASRACALTPAHHSQPTLPAHHPAVPRTLTFSKIFPLFLPPTEIISHNGYVKHK